MTYAVWFDISREPFHWWPLWLVWAIALVALLAAFFSRLRTDHDAVSHAALLFVLALVASAYFGFQFQQYHRFRVALASGRYSTAEGCVSNFTPASIGSHKPDRFSVAGHEFAVGPRLVSPAYHDTVANGDRSLSGMQVRMKYTDGDQIIWLGVAGACTDTAVLIQRAP